MRHDPTDPDGTASRGTGTTRPEEGWVERTLTVPSELLEGASVADLDAIVLQAVAPGSMLSSVNVTSRERHGDVTVLGIRAWAHDLGRVRPQERGDAT